MVHVPVLKIVFEQLQQKHPTFDKQITNFVQKKKYHEDMK